MIYAGFKLKPNDKMPTKAISADHVIKVRPADGDDGYTVITIATGDEYAVAHTLEDTCRILAANITRKDLHTNPVQVG